MPTKTKKLKVSENGMSTGSKVHKRLPVKKTYKLYIGGKFPRSESGRYYVPKINGRALGNICQGSRKDMRNAVVAARAAQAGWQAKSAFNRSQILYRMAEMLEGRSTQFIDELIFQGSSQAQAKKEIELSIDRLIYYAGWCDKFQQIFSSVNPVASSHFNFSIPEPTGVVFIFGDQSTSLLGLVSLIAPVITGGNSCVILASESKPLSAITFSEVINDSDVPGGVINILTGFQDELLKHVAGHLDINAVVYSGRSKKNLKTLQQDGAINVKRIRDYQDDWCAAASQNPYKIMDVCEIKTTWHPIEVIGPSGSGY